MWIAADDTFTFKSKKTGDQKSTKRNLLSKIATMFDPLGFKHRSSFAGR